MAKLKIIKYGHPVLRQKAALVTEINDEIRSIIKDMNETLSAENGVGLAAPQVGISKRIFIVDLTKADQDKKVVLLNPKIIFRSAKTSVSEEGCLSIPDVWGPVRRSDQIKIKGELLNGRSLIIEAEGLFGRALQHEFDHLNGVLFIDHIPKDALEQHREKLDAMVEENRNKVERIAL